MRLFRTIAVAFALLFSVTSFAAEKVTVLAAASLTNALEDIKTEYLKTHPDTDIIFAFASSSVLAKQIENGASADIFISADQKWMDYLIEEGSVKDKDLLLKNSLVLIAPANSEQGEVVIDETTDWSKILPAGTKMAVGDTSHVPAGIYAKEALTKLGVFDKLVPQMINASNVRDALMYVDRGETALGIVYKTDADVTKNVKIVGEFPQNTYTPVEYPSTLLNKNGQAFYDYLTSETAQEIFVKYGFVLP